MWKGDLKSLKRICYKLRYVAKKTRKSYTRRAFRVLEAYLQWMCIAMFVHAIRFIFIGNVKSIRRTYSQKEYTGKTSWLDNVYNVRDGVYGVKLHF